MLEPTSRHGPYMSDMGCASIGVMTCQKEPDKQTPGEHTHRARCKFTPQTECFPSVQIIPLVNVYTAIENGQRNSWFVDLPIKKMVIFHSYVRLPEGNPIGFRVQSSLKRTHHFLWPFKKQTSPLSMWNSTEVYQVSFSGSRSALGNPLNRAQPQELDAAAAQGGATRMCCTCSIGWWALSRSRILEVRFWWWLPRLGVYEAPSTSNSKGESQRAIVLGSPKWGLGWIMMFGLFFGG